MRRASFLRSVQQFLRQEDGVAFITFGMFIVILGIPVLIAVLDWGWRSLKSYDEMGEKTQEYSIEVTSDYGELFLKRALCQQNQASGANCDANADSTHKIFTKALSSYVYGGNGSDPQAVADMQEYLDNAFNKDIGQLRFQNSEVPKVAISCYTPTNRLLLTFTTQAPAFTSFWHKPSEMVQTVKRLSSVPCSFDDNNIKVCTNTNCSESFTGPSIGATCAHGKKPRAGSKVGTESVEFTESVTAKNQVNLGQVRSVVNFVVSLDARSNQELGGSKNFISRFAGSLLNASGTEGNLSLLGAGMTMGNMPMRGNSANCAENKSNLQYSGSCYDDKDTFQPLSRTGPTDPAMETAGLGNTNRKGPFTGEFRAQYTRRCPASDARWTYEVKKARDCYEESFSPQEQQVGGRTAADTTIPSENVDDSATRQALADQLYANAGGDGYCPGGRDYTAGYNIDPNTLPGMTCGGAPLTSGDIAAGQRCYKFSITCIHRDQADQSVMAGHWYASCRSENLGASGSNIYGEPSQYLDFRGKLAADLETIEVTNAQHLKVELKADIAKALDPTTMRATDAGVLNQINELTGLHVKNTERAFYWSCEKGPQDTTTGKPAANDGNLGKPYGERAGTDLVKDDGTETNAAQNVTIDNSGTKGCKIPTIGTVSAGKMVDTVNTYDLTYKRNDCTNCGIPEGLYAMTLQPSGTPLQTSVTPVAVKIPTGDLKTTWRPAAGDLERYQGNLRWAWAGIGTVTGGAAECPVDGSTNPCPGGYVDNIDHTRHYCQGKLYDTTYHHNAATCNEDGSACQNIARYIATDADATTTDMTPERLNISSVALERRIIPDGLGNPTPYTCTLDKGETKTGSRSNYVSIAGGLQDTNPQCNGAPFFCQHNASPSITTDEVEENFIDANATGSVSGGGIFSLTADNFNSILPLGDDAEQFGSQSQKINFKTRKMTQGLLKSKIDPNITIMPAQVETEEVVHYTNADLAPDNMEILDTADQFQNVVKEIAKGYGRYDILPYHNGNQCALFRQGLRNLWRGVDGVVYASKFAVYIGSLPTAADYTAITDPSHNAHGLAAGAAAPGEYDGPNMKLKLPMLLSSDIKTSTKPAEDIVSKCFYSADKDSSTTPFIVTTLGSAATSTEVSGLLSALQTATFNTTNESCKRPYCLLSNTDGELNGTKGDNIMTPETCAAKLWKCIRPAGTKF